MTLSANRTCKFFLSRNVITVGQNVTDPPSLSDLLVKAVHKLRHVEPKEPQQTCAVGRECAS